MTVIRNIEISRRFDVSPSTVTNWIKRSIEGSEKLILSRVNGKYFIKNTPDNIDLIYRLKNLNSRYKPKAQNTVVKPNNDIYKTFTPNQLADLIYNLEANNFIPLKYSYFAEGADMYFNAVEEELMNSESVSTLSKKETSDYLITVCDDLIKKGYKINVVEIGHDYGTHCLIDLIKYLKAQKAFGKYISICASPRMNQIRLQKVRTWAKVEGICYELDYEQDSLQKTLLESVNAEEKIINLCLFLECCTLNTLDVEYNFSRALQLVSKFNYVVVKSSYKSENKSPLNTKQKTTYKGSGFRKKRWNFIYKLLGITNYVVDDKEEKLPVFFDDSEYYVTCKSDFTIDFGKINYKLDFQFSENICHFVIKRPEVNWYLSKIFNQNLNCSLSKTKSNSLYILINS